MRSECAARPVVDRVVAARPYATALGASAGAAEMSAVSPNRPAAIVAWRIISPLLMVLWDLAANGREAAIVPPPGVARLRLHTLPRRSSLQRLSPRSRLLRQPPSPLPA